MPIDAVFLESLCEELQEKLLACRVDKVQQPERDTILLSMRGASGGGKLLLTASPSHPRIQLTNLSFENPAQPPIRKRSRLQSRKPSRKQNQRQNQRQKRKKAQA